MSKPATIAEYHAAQVPQDSATMERLRRLIDAALPDAESKLWHAHPVWFLQGNPIVGYQAGKGGVRLMFWSGQSFATPGLEANGSFKAATRRYADEQAIDEAELGQWLVEARTTQWDYKNIVKRKGRLERLC
ncbi:MAG: DUF1801 domain-containing protein [Erythrobacter sp.]|nr:DUF1801 domain-containing protein [Erythrobacter sp.]